MKIEIYKNNDKPTHLAIPVERRDWELSGEQEYKSLCGADVSGMERDSTENPYLLAFPCKDCDKQLDYIKDLRNILDHG